MKSGVEVEIIHSRRCEMKTTRFVALLIVGVAACSSLAYAQSDTEKEVKQHILEAYEYISTNLKYRSDGTSQYGSLEFWSSGGLLREIAPGGRAEEYDIFSIQPKHIKVISLVEGQAAVAQFYMEGLLQLKGAPLVSHYLTRATQVFVKEDGKWKIRAAHWSPIAGGSGVTTIGQREGVAPAPQQ
jgi:hypothetical protein